MSDGRNYGPIVDQESLSGLLAGKSDDAIEELALDIGVQAVLTRIFSSMEETYSPALGPGKPAVMQWKLSGPDGREYNWQLAVEGESCGASTGEDRVADATFMMSFVTFVKVVAGLASGFVELQQGRVDIQGDVALAITVPEWFDV